MFILLFILFLTLRLNDEARRLIAELGSTSITNLAFRDNWVFCGGKGIKTKSPFEQVSVLDLHHSRMKANCVKSYGPYSYPSYLKLR